MPKYVCQPLYSNAQTLCVCYKYNQIIIGNPKVKVTYLFGWPLLIAFLVCKQLHSSPVTFICKLLCDKDVEKLGAYYIFQSRHFKVVVSIMSQTLIYVGGGVPGKYHVYK